MAQVSQYILNEINIDEALLRMYGTTRPIKPLQGHTPRKYDRLMERPRQATEDHLEWAEEILGRGDYRFLRHIRTLGFPHWEEMWRSYVDLAVYQQWQYFAPEKLLEVLKNQAKLVSRTKRNRLYRWGYEIYDAHRGGYNPRKRLKTLYYLAYICPSTGKLYISGVPTQKWVNPRAADRAMGWKFGLTLEEYDQLKVEA